METTKLRTANLRKTTFVLVGCLLGLISCGSKTQTNDVTQNPAPPTEAPPVPLGTPPPAAAAPTEAPLGLGPAPLPPAMPVTGNPLLTQENLDRIQKDMTPAQVVAILGKPTSSQESTVPVLGGTETSYQYDGGNSSVTIVFRNDRMKLKTGHFENP